MDIIKVYVVVDGHTDTGVYATTDHAEALRMCTLYMGEVREYTTTTYTYYRTQDRVRALAA